VPEIDQIVDVAAGELHSCAVRADGGVWCWGSNRHGECGGDPKLHETFNHPVPINGLPSIRAVTTGIAHSCALDGEQRAWCWGYNGQGSLGSGAITNLETTPVQVAAVGNTVEWLSVDGMTGCAIALGGRPLCWPLYGSLVPIEVKGLCE